MEMESYSQEKTEIISTCLALEKMGYFIGTWGNISVRISSGLLVTPSRIANAEMVVDDIVTVSDDGSVLCKNNRLPSSEMVSHKAIFNKRKDVGAVIHNHSPYATAVSMLHQSIPPIVEEIAQIVGGEIHCSNYIPAAQHQDFANEIARTIGQSNAVLAANHGVFCCGRNLAEAFLVSKIVEKAAMMFLMASAAGAITVIPDEFVASERYRYLHHYGNKSDFEQATS